MGRANSLRTRLLYSLAIVLVLFLGVMGWVIDQAFKNSTEQSIREKLLLHTYGLLSVSDQVDDASLFLPEVLYEPRFNTLGSGLYALVFAAPRSEIWRSPSSLDLEPAVDRIVAMVDGLTPGDARFGKTTIDDREKFFFAYQVLWETSEDGGDRYTYVVLEDSGPFRKQVAEFRNGLWGGMLGVVLLLLVVQGAIMRWSLAPLRQIADELSAMEEGRQQTVEGDYPKELSQLTDNLNLLINSEREQRERYRTTMADLAHSLKTPLAILRGEASVLQLEATGQQQTSVDSIGEQVDRMDDIIGYQLERAVSRGAGVARTDVPIEPVFARLTDALRKVYVDKQVDFHVDIPPDCRFSADERDLMELAGNLLDNACKYGAGHVGVGAATSASGDLSLVVEDNGPGFPAGTGEQVLNRGERLDTREKGQGIGLAVVAEIVSRYSGVVTVGEAAGGGARVEVTLSAESGPRGGA